MTKKLCLGAFVFILVLLLGSNHSSIKASADAGSEADYLPIRLSSATFDPLKESPVSFLPENLRLSDYPPAIPGYYIVQFKGPIYDADKKMLVDLGVQIFDYIPEFSFVVRMDKFTAAIVAGLDAVRWVGIYQPGYRISPALAERYLRGDLLTGPDGENLDLNEIIRLNVLIFKGEDISPITQRLETLGGTILNITQTEWRGKIRVEIASKSIPMIAAINGVSWIESAPVWQLNNQVAHTDEIMNVEKVWNIQHFYGSGQIGAISDTQLDTGNATSIVQDFKDCNGGAASRFTIIQLGTATSDTHGHGTHTAGSFLGNGYLAGGRCGSYAGYPAGSAPQATGYFQAIMNTDGSLGGIPSDLNNLFQPAYNFGARIHTNSWGSAVMGEYTAESQEADQFSWTNKNFLIFFSAGNNGVDIDANGVIDLGSLGSPATAKDVFTVGASENLHPGYGTYIDWDTPVAPIYGDDYSNNVNGLAAFSSRGPTDDGRYKPDIVAPGIWVNSVRSTAGPYSGNYIWMGGTSMSTPLTAGAAILAREAFMSGETYAPSAAMLKSLMTNGATDIYPGQYGTGATQEIPNTRPTYQAGWGRVNLEDSLFPSGSRRTWWWDIGSELQSNLNPLTTGGSVTYSFQVLSSLQLHATMAWSDYPGTPAASGGLVNDLDIRLDGPSGTTYYANNAKQRAASELLEYATTWDTVRQGTNGQKRAVRITPAQYPAVPAFAKLWFYNNGSGSSGSVNFNLVLYDDNGSPGPTNGTVLCTLSGKRAAWGSASGAYPVIIDLSSCGTNILSGDFYLSLEFTNNSPAYTGFLMDNTPLNRSWQNTAGTWSIDTSYDYDFAAVVYRPVSPTTSYDRVNNLEGIDIASPATGVYTLTVSGYNIPQGPQPYALTLSGDYQMLGKETVTRPINGTGTYKFGNSGVTVQFTSEAIDSVAVSVTRNRFPTTGMNSVKRFYDITASGGTGAFNANVTFSYEQAEFAASGISNEASLRAYHYSGGVWIEYPATVDTVNNTVTVNGVTAFSRWTLGNPAPTALSLTSLTARSDPRSPVIIFAGISAIIALGVVVLAIYWRRHT